MLLSGLLLYALHASVPLPTFAPLGLFGFFAWNRPRYGWSVACITICVHISMSVYRGAPWECYFW
ncbi:hypothetical protein [Mucilaginibacter sp. UYCu711]|uniref:hypothetical protein n=1 Tax=Mucilaginibacter sp. UYCu711 TaxID=3156339 RepID=UPI003D223896